MAAYYVLLVTLFLALFDSICGSKCVVSKWKAWSPCIGNCGFAMRVRNRDVLRPPFPERDPSNGQLVLRECPVLYETEYCTPQGCEDESPFSLTNIPLVGAPEKEAFEVGHPSPALQRVQPKPSVTKKTRKAYGINLYTASRPECGDGQHKRCCRVVRQFCPDGSRPKEVIRWYRRKNENFCRSFRYPYCGEALEGIEVPLQAENVCTELCFTEEEKTILPSLRLIR